MVDELSESELDTVAGGLSSKKKDLVCSLYAFYGFGCLVSLAAKKQANCIR